MTADAEKSAARHRAKVLRDTLNLPHAPAQLAGWAGGLHPLTGGGPVAGFFPFGSEIDVRPLMTALHDLGCALALPVIVGREKPLEFRQWTLSDPLHPGPMGILQPGPDAPILRPALVLTPLLAFDRQGWRLGYGGGYYDRTLTQLGQIPPVVAVGVAFSGQEIAEVPHQPHDRRLDFVATELELIRI